MATTRRTAREPDGEPDATTTIERTLTDAAVTDVADVLSSLGAQTRCQVNRALQAGKVGRLGRVDLEALGDDPADFLARTYGPGPYILEFFAPKSAANPSGYIKHARTNLVVDDDHPGCIEFRTKKRVNLGGPGVGSSGVDGGSGGNDIMAMGLANYMTAMADGVRAMREGGNGSESMMAMMQQQFQASQAAAQQQATQSQQVMQMFMTMMQTMSQQSQASQQQMTAILTAMISGKSDPMELATQMAGLLKGGNGQPTTMMEMLTGLKAMKDFVADKDSDDEPESVIVSVVKHLSPALVKLVEAGTKPAAATSALGLAPGSGTIAPATQVNGAAPVPVIAPTTEHSPETDMVFTEDSLKAAIREWVKLAEAKKNPEREAAKTWAQLDMLPTMRNQAYELLAETVDGTDDGEFTLEGKITAWVPEAAPYREWFGRFVDELRVCAEIVDENDDDDDGDDDDNDGDGDGGEDGNGAGDPEQVEKVVGGIAPKAKVT